MGTIDLDRDNAVRPRRRSPSEGAPPPPLPGAEVDWRDQAAFSEAAPTAEILAFAEALLRQEGLAPEGAPVLLRHRPGDRGLPGDEGQGLRFALDLTGSRSSLLGGALVFFDDTGRGAGWRAETGALTVWSGPDPDLTELVPGAPERLTLIGRARELVDH
jgi:hypothetical protein